MIVFPMAGISRRFREAGYDRPKYMLEARGRSLFDHAVAGFDAYFATEPFLFVCRAEADTPAFIARSCERLGIARASIVTLDTPTRGQAETVALGIDRAGVGDDDSLTIFNIDTFRPDYRRPAVADLPGVAGYLEVFPGSGANWSFVRPVAGTSDRVAETAEKRPLSDLCCTGLYSFTKAEDFRNAYTLEAARDATTLDAGELYVAPLYNHLITKGRDVRYHVIRPDAVIFCGVPAEYDAFRSIT